MADRMCVDCGAVANTWDDPDDPCPSRCADCLDKRMAEVTRDVEARMMAIPHPTSADLVRELYREIDELVDRAGVRRHFAEMFVAQAATAAGVTMINTPRPWRE